jgi:hypothetical protein
MVLDRISRGYNVHFRMQEATADVFDQSKLKRSAERIFSIE